MFSKTAGCVANSVDHDQTPRSWRLILVYTISSRLFVQIFRVNTVNPFGSFLSEVKHVNALDYFRTFVNKCPCGGAHMLNFYHSKGKFSRRQTDHIFLIFPGKQTLTIYANCLLRRQFAWIVKAYFLREIRIFQMVVRWKSHTACYM